MPTKRDFHKVVIGRSEVLTFVDFGIAQIPAKVDTGAYRSAIHASDIVCDGTTLSFTLLAGHPNVGVTKQVVTTTSFHQVGITNSFGQSQDRYEVKLKVKLGPKIFTDGFTLTDRSKMTYPILLGRMLLKDRFIIVPAVSSLDRITLQRLLGIDFPKDEEEGRDK